MCSVAAKNAQVSIVVDKSIESVLTERAQRLNLSRSKFAALVLAKWAENGFPAVSEADKAMMILHGKTSTQKPKKTA